MLSVQLLKSGVWKIGLLIQKRFLVELVVHVGIFAVRNNQERFVCKVFCVNSSSFCALCSSVRVCELVDSEVTDLFDVHAFSLVSYRHVSNYFCTICLYSHMDVKRYTIYDWQIIQE